MRITKKNVYIAIIAILLALLVWFIINTYFNPDCSFGEVELISFSGRTIPVYNVLLGWRLSQNENVDTYHIYRSDTTKYFVEVGHVVHPETTFVDTSLYPNHYYWQVSYKDVFGNEQGFSNVVDTLLADYPADSTAPLIPIDILLEVLD